MARVLTHSSLRVQPIDSGWAVASCAPGQVTTVEALESAGLSWVPATVPGTVAQALAAAGQFDPAHPGPLDDRDHWFRCEFRWAGAADATLRLEGLATICEVFLNGRRVLESSNMFHQHALAVSGLGALNTLHLRFLSLSAWLEGKKGRARWRPKMVQPASMRFARTTALGRTPSWCPSIQAVGPWRPISLEEGPLRVESASLRARLEGTAGVVQAKLAFSGPAAADLQTVSLQVGDAKLQVRRSASGEFAGSLRVEGVERWWPHTHGAPALYPVSVGAGDARLGFGSTGFRTLTLDRERGAFALSVNGERIFCRGACWTTADLLSLGSRYAPWLELAHSAGMNMLRVPGISVYESADFFAQCDALGILVWQDFMFANFDFPHAEPGFRQSVEREAAGVLNDVQLSPSLAVLCGGSEVEQQAAMLGLTAAESSNPLNEQWLPAVAGSGRPDVPYVSSSPTGGPLPFVSNAGCAHYYGVGAYRRPLEDARRAEVKFASEALGFANLPERGAFTEVVGWEARVPKDFGADDDFADVRDFYLKLLYREEPAALRATDPDRYAALSAEVTGEVMGEVFAEWRRARSGCAGGLVWFLQDLWPSPGWGVIDSRGVPKPAWHHLVRAFAPRAVFLTDEGVNGLAVHVVNDTAQPLEATVKLELLLEGKVRVGGGEQSVSVGPRAAVELSAFELLPGFLDISHAYRFGPAPHHVTVATLAARDGTTISEAFHFPQGRWSSPRPDVGLTASCARDAEGWALTLSSDGFVQSVRVDAAGFTPSDGGFHLLAGRPRVVRLTPRGHTSAPPEGEVRAITLAQPVTFSGAPAR